MRLSACLGLLCLALMTQPAIADDSVKGDPAKGEAIYDRCLACHSLTRNRTGPKHCGLLGRLSGSVDGFDYSPAMRGAAIVWDAASLDAFLADPLAVVPETTMGYDGVKDARERADLIAFLATATASSHLCQ